jgi:hypothetical protein
MPSALFSQMDLISTAFGNERWMELAQGRGQWHAAMFSFYVMLLELLFLY